MDGFHYRAGRLHGEDVPLDTVALQVGTPAYVYSLGAVEAQVAGLRSAFADLDPFIAYAVKANANLALLAHLRDLGLGFDIVSGGELDRLRRLGVPGDRILFSGVAKSEAEQDAALAYGVRAFNVESSEELASLSAVARRRGARAPVAVRVNPDVEAATHRYIQTGSRENKFGVDPTEAERLVRVAVRDDALRLVGLQCHIGSQIVAVEPFAEAARRMVALAARLRAVAPELTTLDLGGGFGIAYRGEQPPTFDEYAAALRPIVAQCGLDLVLEPGRVLVGQAGVLLTRVVYLKQSGDRTFVIVDAGMNDLMRPSLYDAWHRIWPVVGPPPPAEGESPAGSLVDVVGPICESADCFAKDRRLPPLAPGDLLAISSVGAYGFAMSSQYNARPRPVEVLVAGGRFAVARRRETFDDLVLGEEAAPAWRASDPPRRPRP